ncbi:MAG: type II secretion system F family protein [bacterium]|nr:type II secretion system F family protein [bacterium]
MREFRYSALTASGTTITGMRRAVSADQLAGVLLEQGLVLLTSRSTLGSLGGAWSPVRRAARRHLRSFTQHMATSLSAGVPAVTALRDYEQQCDGAFADLMADLRAAVTSGSQLDEALARHPHVFSPVYLALVSAGQSSGGLDGAFNQLTAYLEWQEDLRGQTTQALIYPAMLMVGVLGLFLLMVLFVMPRFEGLFRNSGMELPAVTRAMLGLGSFCGHWWWALITGAVALAAVIRLATSTRRGAYLRDRLLLRLPVVGTFVGKLALSRFAKTFAIIFASGVDLLRLLDLLRGVVGNRVMAAQLRMIRAQVASGLSLTEAFSGADTFPPLVQRMIAVGERTGSLDKSLLTVSAHLDKELPRDLKKAFTVFEGLVLVLLGAMVCLAALSLLMPIMSIRATLH